MNFAKFEFKKKLQRIVAKVTLVAMVVTMAPVVSAPAVAQAADADIPAKITLTDHGYGAHGNVTYTSVNGLGSCDIHLLKGKAEGQEETIAFCADHTKRLVARVKGKEWNNPQEVTNKWALMFLDCYYHNYNDSLYMDQTYPGLTPEQRAEKAATLTPKRGYYTEWQREYNCGFVQGVVWLSLTGKITDSMSQAQVTSIAAAERDAILEKYGYDVAGAKYTSTQAVTDIMTNSTLGVYPKQRYFKYSFAGQDPKGEIAQADMQPLILPVTKPITNGPKVWIKVKKVDDNGQALSGAEFSVKDSSGHELYTFTTSGEGKAYGPISLPEDTTKTTLTVTETKAPQTPKKYKITNAEGTVEVDTTKNNTEATAAEVLVEYVNIPIDDDDDDDTPTAVINKVDARTGEGIGPATFQLRGNSESGKAIDTQRQCDAQGKLELQWTNPANMETYIEPGQYTVTEVNPPQGYDLSNESYHLRLWIDADGNPQHTGPLTFHNKKQHKIIIKKVGVDGAPLDGAVFEIRCNDQLVATETTQNGEIVWAGTDGKGAKSGCYEIREVKAPKGFLLPFIHSQHFIVSSDDTAATEHVATFSNYTYPDIIIQKLEAGTETPLAGAVFEIYIDGTKRFEKATGADGTITINYDEYGDFLKVGDRNSWTIGVKEIQAPNGYILDDSGIHEAELIEGQTLAPFVFTDTKYPDIKILKLDRETGDPLPNASFRVAIDGAEFEQDIVTGDDGTATITYAQYKRFLDEKNKDNWTITVTETHMPDKYNKDKQEATGDYTLTQQLKYGQSLAVFTFKDTHYRDIKVTKRDAQTNWPLAGATFRLHCVAAENKDAGNITDRELTTDNTGFVVFEDVPNGTYHLTEVAAPFGYVNNDEVKTVIVTSDNDPVIEFSFENEPKSGILIRKIDSVTKQPIPNVEFKITPLAPLTAPSVNKVTDDNGVIVLEGISEGTYRIEEVTTVDGYVLDKEPKLVEVKNQHDAYTVTFENNQKNMLNVLKLDAITKEPLAGAIFEVRTAGGTHVANIETGIYGYANLPNLKPGSYVVQEVSAPEGHIIDPMPQTFEVKDDDSGNVYTLVFSNSPHANIYIRKYDAETKIGLEGAVFRITRSNGELVKEFAKTDAGGFIHVGELTGDTYQIQEIEAPQGYLLDSTVYTLQLDDGETKNIEIANRKPGGFAIQKVDAETGAALEGATFELRAIGGELIGSKTTGADGYARWEKIEPGWYVATETDAPEGYILDSTPKNIEVKEFVSTEIKWENSQHASLTVVTRDKDSDIPLKRAQFEIRCNKT